ncbi:MAG: acetate kinase [Bacteroidales bacterium]|nr:acetate kinase [Bacteroidales bacterium]
MKILTLNCGSSSIKYQLFDFKEGESLLVKGLLERIGCKDSVLTHKVVVRNEEYSETRPVPSHTEGIQWIINWLIDEQKGVLKQVEEITAAGHRVAHGGEYFPDSALITPEVKKKIEDLIELAPLHNPANLRGILAMENLLPGIPQVAVFDTSFHHTLPPRAYFYALPYEYYEKYKIRRYGFHGTSHKYVAQKAASLIGRNWEELKIITCHLGNGSSITAIDRGKSVDTSMGFTPVEGLVMGTRTGDLDLGALLSIMDKEKLDTRAANDLINKKSGMLGLSGISNDMRDIERAAHDGNQRAQLALEVFAYRIKKYIGAYVAAMNGLDLLVFTGGIGENDYETRQHVCANMEYLGIKIDLDKNCYLKGKDEIISLPDSPVKVVIACTNEELVIARDTYRIISKK